MRTTIDALWKFALTLWRRRNKELHSDDGTLSSEAKRKDALTRATAAYHDTLDQVLSSDSLILHRTRVTNMINWTKQHLDAYLATAETAHAHGMLNLDKVIFPVLCRCMRCGTEFIWYVRLV
jgi:hypothetical protein